MNNLGSKIIVLYGLGMSFRDISSHLKEMYDADISHATLSAISPISETKINLTRNCH
jgi:transposase-like protein